METIYYYHTIGSWLEISLKKNEKVLMGKMEEKKREKLREKGEIGKKKKLSASKI